MPCRSLDSSRAENPSRMPIRRLLIPMARLHHISRIDNEARRTHAWQVRVQRGNRILTKSFSDGLYGGKRKALRAAVEYRDQVIEQIPSFEHQLWLRNRLRRNNSSGIAGVSRHDLVDPRDNARRVFWLASWIDEHGVSRKRKFSILLYGEDRAKQLAIDEREHQLRRVCALKRG